MSDDEVRFARGNASPDEVRAALVALNRQARPARTKLQEWRVARIAALRATRARGRRGRAT